MIDYNYMLVSKLIYFMEWLFFSKLQTPEEENKKLQDETPQVKVYNLEFS